MAQTFLTPSEIDQLVADYEAGSGVQELAEKYGIRRATVFAHLQRRGVPRRRPGLNKQEQAKAVRLSREDMTMRASADVGCGPQGRVRCAHQSWSDGRRAVGKSLKPQGCQDHL